MDSKDLLGTNFKVSKEYIEAKIHDIAVYATDDGRWWSNLPALKKLPWVDAQRIFTEIPRYKASLRIYDYAKAVVKSGRGVKVEGLKISTLTAALLFLEGVITKEHFEQAKEEGKYILLTGVKIGGVLMHVRIFQSLKWDAQVTDKHGAVYMMNDKK